MGFKKLVFLFLGILIALLYCTACTKLPEKTVIKYSSWGGESEISILTPMLAEFERQNPDIKVEFIHIPKNYFQKLHLLVASNLAPDVIFINNLNGVVYAKNDITKLKQSYSMMHPLNKSDKL